MFRARTGTRFLKYLQGNVRAYSAAVTAASVEITPRCVNRIQQLRSQRDKDIALRVTVDGGGCSGFQYAFEIEEWASKPGKDSLPNEDDNLFEKDGTFVIVDDISLAYIAGAKVDYMEELISSSFRIADNPQSESSCGCGASFTPKA